MACFVIILSLIGSQFNSVNLRDSSGTPYGIPHIGNKPRVITTPCTYAIAKGACSGQTGVMLYGRNGVVGTAYEVVGGISGPQEYMVDTDSAEHVKLLSTNANDSLNGTGANTVAIYGLNASFSSIGETVNMDGQTAVTASSAYVRVKSMRVITAGTSYGNIGTIYLTDNGGTDSLLAMEDSVGQSNHGIYTVPVNYTLYITHFFGSEASNKGSEIAVYARPPGGAWFSPIGTDLFNSFADMPLEVPFSIAECTDIEFRCKSVQAGGIVTAGMLGWIESE